ncbi:adenosylhomocysteinase [Aliamphritea hakodatensis]|uniref:adenosylhomocysteinase n=1 Tax=Aliamphritea hakodatensis TaxID=2895352 RepID=UPI0022FD4ED5|nr:adenosylhomocysteinase [Aliamphritea hakodatensis]
MNPLFIKSRHFFEDIQPQYTSSLNLVVVTHLLDIPTCYLDCLERFARVSMVVPKPRSISHSTLEQVEKKFPVVIKKRDQLQSADVTAAVINDHVPEGDLIIIDIGGYFAASVSHLPEMLQARLKGIVEITENGHQRYSNLPALPVPVISIARSPLKGPEDYLTGQSIVYSSEALMRQCHHIMNGGNAVVFGYGKIGSSIAKALHAKNINTKIVEIDPIRAIEARSRGFDLIQKDEALQQSDVIFCATGNQSLSNHDFSRIKNGAFIFSVTSSDDELDLKRADNSFNITPVTEYVSQYERLGQYFYLGNYGNAINFIHNAEVGPYIYLVQGEAIMAVDHLQKNPLPAGISNLAAEQRRQLATSWLAHFG